MRCKKCDGILKSPKNKTTRDTGICGRCRGVKTGRNTRVKRKSSFYSPDDKYTHSPESKKEK